MEELKLRWIGITEEARKQWVADQQVVDKLKAEITRLDAEKKEMIEELTRHEIKDEPGAYLPGRLVVMSEEWQSFKAKYLKEK